MIGKPDRRNREPHRPVPTPGPEDNHPFLSESRQPVERLFVRMSLAPGAVPTPGSSILLSFGGGTTIRDGTICHLLLDRRISVQRVGSQVYADHLRPE